MAGSVNKVILLGNLGQDPVVRTSQDGNKIVQLSIATSERWKDRNSGEQREKTEWHRVVIFNENLSNIAEQYLKKGSTIFVEGQLQTRKWQDQNGVDKYTTEIVLGRFRGELAMIGNRNDNIGITDGQQGISNINSMSEPSQKDISPPIGGAGDLDDEIPF
jgi:single-strand DNA-binding protein